jgi:O6-methylguanine-DNA--protein-cysteine methyltransferase
VGQNQNPIIIPRHRVIKSDYSIGEYTYKGKRNQKKKIELLTSEGVLIKNKKVIICL